jgi:hypothetical protein
MKIYIKASKFSDNIYYRAVPAGSDPLKFQWYQLGIHCGSLEQAQYLAENSNCDIYEVILKPSVIFSNPVSDFEEWSSAECLDEILNVGFNVDISRSHIIQDLRNGIWTKQTAAQYIIDNVGKNAVVKYDNHVELDEEDIIILDTSVIKSIEKIN